MKHFVIILVFAAGRIVRHIYAESRAEATRAALDDIEIPKRDFAIIFKGGV
jgi:hypothetical protein